MSLHKIDLHLIESKYAHTRILDSKTVLAMMRSLDQFGQTTPVTLITAKAGYILIDGYIRIRAMAKLGWDTVLADISEVQEKDAILHHISRQDKRVCNPLEQASLIHELKTAFDLSLSQIANDLGKHKSWVKRRLDLLHSLPDNVLELIRSGDISTWSASRVLAPLARANPEHADKLLSYLAQNTCSTRELAGFLAKYKKSTSKERQRLLDNIDLFMKLQKAKEQKEKDKALLQSPEDKWMQDMAMACSILKRQSLNTEALFASLGRENSEMCHNILSQLERLVSLLSQKAQRGIDHAASTNAGDHPADASERNQHQGDLQAAQVQQEHGS